MSNAIYSDGTYLDKNPDWHAEDAPWKAQQITKILGRNNLSPKTVCEIGRGAGEVLKILKEKLGVMSKQLATKYLPKHLIFAKQRKPKT